MKNFYDPSNEELEHWERMQAADLEEWERSLEEMNMGTRGEPYYWDRRTRTWTRLPLTKDRFNLFILLAAVVLITLVIIGVLI